MTILYSNYDAIIEFILEHLSEEEIQEWLDGKIATKQFEKMCNESESQ